MIAWSTCPTAKTHRSTSIAYNGIRNFTLTEDVWHKGPPSGNFKGKIEVKRSPLGQDSDIRVDIYSQSTSLTFLERLAMEEKTDGLSIRSERSAPEGCTVMNIFVSVSPGLSLDRLNLKVQNFAVELRKGLALDTSQTDIFTVTEPVANSEIRNYSPDKLSIKTLTGRIFGDFPIPRALYLSTEAGDINIRTPVFPRRDVDAVSVHARSVSSNMVIQADPALTIYHSPAHLSALDFQVTVKSVSGSITISNLPQGSSTTLESVAGSVDAKLLQLGLWGTDALHESRIITEVPFGQTDLTLATPLFQTLPADLLDTVKPKDASIQNDSTLTSMVSKHKTQFGNLHLRYPSTWEGVIKGSTLSGSLDAVGQGLDVVEHPGLGSNIKAIKGNENGSSLTLETLSGNAEILVG